MALRKLHWAVAAIGIAGAGAAAWWLQRAPSGQPAGASPVAAVAGPVAVEVGKAAAVRLDDDAQATGSVRARRSVTLRPEVSGRIASLGFRDGQPVRQGQLLVQLDDQLQRAQLRQAEAQASLARSNLQRSRDLAAQNFVSQSAVDQNAAALDVALAQVALAQAQAARMKINAPFDAVAGIRSVDVGDYVKDGADIVALDDVGAVWLDFRLSEQHVPRVRPGQTVQATLDALPGRSFEGTVSALDSEIDANGRALLVRAELRNPAGVLRPGMFARARLVFGTREGAILVPEEALVPLGGRQVLFKVVDGPNGGKVSQRLEAKIGLRVPGKVEILEGLKAGDTVVTAGHGRLVRGDALALRVVDIDKPAGPRGPASAAGSASAAKAL